MNNRRSSNVHSHSPPPPNDKEVVDTHYEFDVTNFLTGDYIRFTVDTNTIPNITSVQRKVIIRMVNVHSYRVTSISMIRESQIDKIQWEITLQNMETFESITLKDSLFQLLKPIVNTLKKKSNHK